MVDNKVICMRCIHKQMCTARRSFDLVSNEWNKQYPFVKMNQDGDMLAEVCSEYKTLTNIHVIEKPETKSNFGVKGFFHRLREGVSNDF